MVTDLDDLIAQDITSTTATLRVTVLVTPNLDFRRIGNSQYIVLLLMDD